MQKLSRRQVIATISTSTLALCPAVLNAAVYGWPDNFSDKVPHGQSRVVMVAAGEAVDITDLQPGEMAVLSRPNSDGEYSNLDGIQYVGVLHRTDAQIAAASDQPGTVQDPRYLVVDLVCPHRGYAIGLTDDPTRPFACTRTGGRHGSIFNASGEAVEGASDPGEFLSVPAYTLSVGSTVTLAIA